MVVYIGLVDGWWMVVRVEVYSNRLVVHRVRVELNRVRVVVDGA